MQFCPPDRPDCLERHSAAIEIVRLRSRAVSLSRTFTFDPSCELVTRIPPGGALYVNVVLFAVIDGDRPTPLPPQRRKAGHAVRSILTGFWRCCTGLTVTRHYEQADLHCRNLSLRAALVRDSEAKGVLAAGELESARRPGRRPGSAEGIRSNLAPRQGKRDVAPQ